MKNVLLIIATISLLISCNKDSNTPQPINQTPTTPTGGTGGNTNFYFNVGFQTSNSIPKNDIIDSIIYLNKRTNELHALNVHDYIQTYFPNNVVVPHVDSLFIVPAGGSNVYSTKVYMPITFIVGDTVDTKIVFSQATALSSRWCDIHMHHAFFQFNNGFVSSLIYEETFVIDHN